MSETTCPSCGTELADGQTVAGKRTLHSKTVSLCKACAEILVLTKVGNDLVLRTISASEYLSLNEKAQLTLRVAFELVRKQRPQPRTPRHLN